MFRVKTKVVLIKQDRGLHLDYSNISDLDDQS